MFKKIREHLSAFLGFSGPKKCRTCKGTGKIPVCSFHGEMAHWPAITVGHIIPKKDCPDCSGKGDQGGIMKKDIKKGDKVRTPSGVGRVIVVDPDGGTMPFLVEIKGWHKGHDAGYWWEREWYPHKYKTPSHSRWWFSAGELEKI